MIIREVKVSELNEFVESELFTSFDIKPLTPQRAFSQLNNPFAKPDDVALVFAVEDNRLLAFAGLLPDMLATGDRISCNSNWWVKPGSNFLAIPVLLKALEKCNHQMFFTDCNLKTKTILEKTGLFEFRPEITGKRFFLRSCFGSVLQRRKKAKLLIVAARIFDFVINPVLNIITKSFLLFVDRSGFTIQPASDSDKSIAQFITENSGDDILSQSVQKLNWIINFPWLKTEHTQEELVYPFSNVVKNFSQNLLVVKRQNEIVGVLIISLVNGMASIPFIYYKRQHISNITIQIRLYLKLVKANSIVVFNDEVASAFANNGLSFFFTRKIKRIAGYAVQLKDKINRNKYFQDGDGDVAFT
jgi:hypothetical protein